MDLVISNRLSNTVSLFVGDGSGGFAAQQAITAGSNAYWMASGDLNGDNKLDLVLSNYYNTFTVLLNTGGGTFSKADYSTGLNQYQVQLAGMICRIRLNRRSPSAKYQAEIRLDQLGCASGYRLPDKDLVNREPGSLRRRLHRVVTTNPDEKSGLRSASLSSQPFGAIRIV